MDCSPETTVCDPSIFFEPAIYGTLPATGLEYLDLLLWLAVMVFAAGAVLLITATHRSRSTS